MIAPLYVLQKFPVYSPHRKFPWRSEALRTRTWAPTCSWRDKSGVVQGIQDIICAVSYNSLDGTSGKIALFYFCTALDKLFKKPRAVQVYYSPTKIFKIPDTPVPRIFSFYIRAHWDKWRWMRKVTHRKKGPNVEGREQHSEKNFYVRYSTYGKGRHWVYLLGNLGWESDVSSWWERSLSVTGVHIVK